MLGGKRRQRLAKPWVKKLPPREHGDEGYDQTQGQMSLTSRTQDPGLRTQQREMWVNFDKWNFLSQLGRREFIALKNVDYANWCYKRIMKGCDVASDEYEFEIPPTRGTLNGAELSWKCLCCSVLPRTLASHQSPGKHAIITCAANW